MNLRKHWPQLVLLLLLGVLGIRFVGAAMRSPLGWQPHVSWWGQVAFGLVGIEKLRLAERDPAVQAEFWLKEISRIEQVKCDPRVAIGAAWMLDSPQEGFLRRCIRWRAGWEWTGLPAAFRRELDFEEVRKAENAFELRCRRACLAMLKEAVRLAPNDVRVCRTRALLLFRCSLAAQDLEPRRGDWDVVLTECAARDPDNALYDYLAAYQLWSHSAEYAYDEHTEEWRIRIHDPDQFAKGNARFAAGLAKPHLKLGDGAYAGTLQLLQFSSLSPSERLTAAGSRRFLLRATKLLYGLMRWQTRRLTAAERTGDLDTAVSGADALLRVSEQLTKRDNSAELITAKAVLRAAALASLNRISSRHPGVLEEDRAAALPEQLAQARLDVEVTNEVAKRWREKLENLTDRGIAQTVDIVLLMVTAQSFVLLGLAGALLASIMVFTLHRIGADCNDWLVDLGLPRHLAAWLLALSVTFVVLGVFPGEAVGAVAQAKFLVAVGWLALATGTIGALWAIQKSFTVPWSQLAALTLLFAAPPAVLWHSSAIIKLAFDAFVRLPVGVSTALVLALIGCLCKLVRSVWGFARSQSLSRRQKRLLCELVFLLVLIALPASVFLARFDSKALALGRWTKPTLWNEALPFQLPPDEVRSTLKLQHGSPIWVFLQWYSHGGVLATVLVAVGAVGVWQTCRTVSNSRSGWGEAIRGRKRLLLCGATATVARTCAWAAVLFFGAYLGAATTVTRIADAHYQVRHRMMIHPSEFSRQIDMLTAEIKSDAATMRRLRAEVAEHEAKLAEQAQWEEQ